MKDLSILIVDDSRLIVEYAKKLILDNRLSADIDSASSGLEAMKLIFEKEYDLILLDVVMPGISGIEVLSRIRKEKDIKESSIIIFTSSEDTETIKQSFELGALDFIKKPFEETEFISRIKNAANRERLKKELSNKLIDIENKNRELITLNRKLEYTQTQLIQKEKMAGVGSLAAGIAHEINNPLGFVSSNIEVLSSYYNIFSNVMDMVTTIRKKCYEVCDTDKELWSKLDDYFKKVNIDFIKSDIKELFIDTTEGINRIIAIINALRSFSSIDTIDNFYNYDINDGINKTLIVASNMYRNFARVRTNLKSNSEVLAMGGLINQVILSLLANSVESIKEVEDKREGIIDIETQEDRYNIYFSISDNGTGIKNDNIKHVFNPFFTTKKIGQGVGFGLTISYDVIVNKHKGKIWIDSDEKSFTKVSFILPKGIDKGNN